VAAVLELGAAPQGLATAQMLFQLIPLLSFD
jgi:hypothetical protein